MNPDGNGRLKPTRLALRLASRARDGDVSTVRHTVTIRWTRAARRLLRFVAPALAAIAALAVTDTQALGQRPVRILLIPLDDRPPCLQFPVRLGDISGAEVVTPPRELLGRFTRFGQPDVIVDWIKQQDLGSFDAAVVSIDMLTYGGLVASRVASSATTQIALARLESVRALRRAMPRIPIYGSSVIMRLAPTADGTNELYRVALARWAALSSDARDSAAAAEAALLRRQIPDSVLTAYGVARRRNFAVNEAAVAMTRDGTLDFLILSQDDASPTGVHVAERERLVATIRSAGLSDRVALHPGADEASMLLLARALARRFGRSPRVFPVFSSRADADRPMPFEDQPLRETVRRQLGAAGGIEVADAATADLLLFVYTSRFERTKATEFAERIGRADKPAIVVDIDPKGDVQGADSAFTEVLLHERRFTRVVGYAAWNTAGNAIGTAVAQGIIRTVTLAGGRGRAAARDKIETAQRWFLLDRLLDDYIYRIRARPGALALIRSRGWDPLRLASAATTTVELWATPVIRVEADRLAAVLGPTRSGAPACRLASELALTLPWGRTFEAELQFALDCTPR